jgi:cell division protein FtsI (penicillin-binding protein 3)
MSATPSVLQRRITIGAVLCVAAFALVGLRLADVTLFAPNALRGKVGVNPVVARADLVDRTGALLARDLRVYDLYVRPHMFADKRQAAHLVATVSGVSEARLYQIFSGKRPYVLAARQLQPEMRDALLKSGLPGLDFEIGGKRNYPGGRLNAQLLGVTDMDGKGVSGLELGLEDRLKGAGAGAKVQTSIDARVQFVLAHEAAASLKEFGARAVGGLVMDVNTGEVLGLVSLPDFDPNDRELVDGDSMRNIMVQDVYELGSVFKVLTFALGIEDHTFRPEETFPIGQGFKIGRFTIHEAEHMPDTLEARDVLAQSSNIGSAQIGLRSGAERQRAFLAHMGLLQPIRTELPEAARPLFPRYWGTVETATIAFGHGISVSPLAYAAAAAAVVNGGRRVTPTFLKHPQDSRGEQLIAPATSAEMRTLLRYVVTNGSGKKADVPGYDVGGKTGSAEKAGKYGYQHGKLVTSFIAVFPVNNPRYLVFVMLDEPHGTKKTAGFALAGYTAAPLAGQVISRIAPLLGVPMSPTEVSKENS